jgi:APA family basic amino acid/polyamine antiporter
MSPSLRRELTVVSATALVVSNMIGTGIFTTTGFLAADLGRTPLVLGVWLAGGIVAMAGCLAYAELSINLTRSGGEYVYLREAWGPSWGFVSGWVSFFAGFSAPIAAAALAFAAYLSYFFPALAVTQASVSVYRFSWLHAGAGQLLAVGAVGVLGVVNILSLRLAANLQNLLTALKLGVLAAFLIFAFLSPAGDWHHLAVSSLRTSSHNLTLQFALSLTFVMFAYSGWNAATYVSEEIRDPRRALPLALVTGTLVVTLLYVACNVAFIYVVPLPALKGVVAVGAEVARAIFRGRGGAAFSGIMSAALLSSINAMTIAGPRVYYAMAQDGCFFLSASRVHARSQTPAIAILFQILTSAAMVVTGTFETLIYYIGFLLVWFAALTTAGIFRLRSRPGWQKLPAVDFLYPAIPVVFLIAATGMLISTIRLRPKESLLGLLTVLCGGLLYRWKFRRRNS